MHHNRHDRGGGKPNMRRKVVSWARNLHVGLDTPLYESPNRGARALIPHFGSPFACLERLIAAGTPMNVH